MSLICPNCQASVESLKDALEEIVCPCCGTSFGKWAGTTADWNAATHQRTLGKFDLIELVGTGAFGSVYKARDRELGRTVAVKVPRADNLGNSGDSDRFLREARSVAQLRHPSIVPVFEIGQESGRPYLVSEFVHGITLADLLTSERPAPRDVAQLIAQIADALDHAHKQGVIHRDVKPSNIMLESHDAREATALGASRGYVPRLMDFGLAKREAGEITMTTEGQVLGTPAYMSPEQARGESHSVDGRSDVYSLGVILYQLLCGELPFKGNARMLLHQVLHDEPKRPRQREAKLPKDLQTICLKSMAKEPSRRYATAGEFASDLRRFLDGEPIRARPVRRTEKLARWCRRNKAVAGLGAAVVVLLGVLVGVATWRMKPQLPPPPPGAPRADIPQRAPGDDLLAVVAELDRTDPRWRLEEIEANRKVIPDERNSVQKVRAVLKVLQPIHWPSREAHKRFTDLSTASPRRLRAQDTAYLRAELEKVAPALATARLMDQYPEGRIPIAWARRGVSGTPLPEHQDVRAVVTTLYWDAVLQADRGDITGAFRSCHGIFNCCRIFGDDPAIIPQLVRIAIARIGVMALERSLAQGGADSVAVEKMQILLVEEAAHRRLSIAARGERGNVHWFMSALAAGDAPASDLVGDPKSALSQEILKQLSNGQNIRSLHAELLEQITRWVEATQLPLFQQQSWVREWEKAQKAAGNELLLAFARGARSVTDSSVSLQSRLNSAIAALAVERYRLAEHAWPANLESLVPVYLPRVPLDPYDGKPLRYRRAAEYVLIYSVGPDQIDNHGALDRTGRAPQDTDSGFELWSAGERGQPPSQGNS